MFLTKKELVNKTSIKKIEFMFVKQDFKKIYKMNYV